MLTKSRVYLLIFILSHTFLWAEQKKFTVSYDPDYAPYSYIQNKEPYGLLIDFWKMWAEYNNYEIQFVNGQLWDNAITMAQKGEVDFFLGTQAYAKWMKSSETFYEDQSVFFALKQNQYVFDKDANILIGVIGYDLVSHVKEFFPNASVIVFDDYSSGVNALLTKSVELIFDVKIAMDFYALQNHHFHKIYALNQPIVKGKIQAISNSQEKIDLFNQSIKKIPHSKLQELEKKWIFNERDYFYIKSKKNTVIFSEEEIAYIENNTLQTAISKFWEPLLFESSKEEKVSGILYDYWTMIVNKSQLKFQQKFYDDFSTQLHELKSNKIDLILGTEQNIETLPEIIQSKKVATFELSIVTRNDEHFIKDASFLIDKKVAVINQYLPYKLLKEHYDTIDLIEVQNIEEGLKLVENHEAFAFVDIEPMVLYHLNKLDYQSLKVTGNTGLSLDVFFLLHSENQMLKSILNKVIDSIPVNKMDALTYKWANTQFKQSFDYDLFWKVIALFVVIALILYYRSFVLNRLNETLEKKVNDKTKELQEFNKNLENRVEEITYKLTEKQKIITQQSKLVAMGEVIENIAHQWRQPLSVIVGESSGIKFQKKLEIMSDEDMYNALDKINHTAIYLSDTIDDFRNFFKSDNERRDYNLKKSFEKALVLVDSNFKKMNINVVKNIDESTLYGVDNEFIQVLINLFNNSIDAFKQNKSSSLNVILIDVLKEENSTVIRIKDSAGGIDDSVIEKVFEPYFTTKHNDQGTGIGLYMSYEIITQHMNGEFSVNNCTFMYEGHRLCGAEFIMTFKSNLTKKEDII